MATKAISDPEAIRMQDDFHTAVSGFLHRMPRSAASKDKSKFPAKRYFYLRDWSINITETQRYVGAHVYTNGIVRTYGMGLDDDVDAEVSVSAMTYVMKLMAKELATRHLV